MKRFFFRFFLILCWMPLLALLAWCVDRKVNLGLHFGYHGELNKVVDAFEDVPGVREVRVVGYNPDVTMEEMGIGIETTRGRELEIWFSEDDPIRKLSKASLTDALARRMEAESGPDGVQGSGSKG